MRFVRNGVRNRRFLLVWTAVATAVLAGAAVVASGAYPTTGVTVFTGCLTTSGTSRGTIGNVAASPTTPAKPCASNQRLIHLSGGTITSLVAGVGLTGGGSNGSVSLSVAPRYQLPQNCTSGQFASSSGVGKGFACGTDTSYSGADFALSSQDCPAGTFAIGIDTSGTLKCGQPTVADLQGSRCTFNGLPSTLVVATDNTTGLVSMICNPVKGTSLAAAANAGDTNIKVAGVSNLGTTLAAAANAGDTNIKVTSTTAFYATTLAASVSAGSTNIKVASTIGLRAGQTVNIDNGGSFESRVIATGGVGTAGATGTGVTLTAALASAHVSGAPVSPAGQTILIDTGAGAEHATIQVLGTSGPGGTGLTLTAPLASAHASGVQVDVATITIDLRAAQETVGVTNVGTAGSGGTGVSFSPALGSAHPIGALIAPLLP